MTSTVESLSQYVECAICKRNTSKNHATQYHMLIQLGIIVEMILEDVLIRC